MVGWIRNSTSSHNKVIVSPNDFFDCLKVGKSISVYHYDTNLKLWGIGRFLEENLYNIKQTRFRVNTSKNPTVGELVKELTSNSLRYKPAKDVVYKVYEYFKMKEDVNDAFESLIDWIEKNNFKTESYFKTDSAQNFDKSYRE